MPSSESSFSAWGVDTRPFPFQRGREQIDLAGASEHRRPMEPRGTRLESGHEPIRDPLPRPLHAATGVKCLSTDFPTASVVRRRRRTPPWKSLATASHTEIRTPPVHLVLDGLPAHKKAIVGDYVASTQGRLTLRFLPGYAPELNPDELAWSHVKRTGVARRPLRKGEKLREKIAEQLSLLRQMPDLIRSFFQAPSVAYIGDC